jgi:Do/DeqQ family serine protease
MSLKSWLPVLFLTGALVSCKTAVSTNASTEPNRVETGGPITPSGPVQSYADVVERVAPAVVTIRSERRIKAPQQFPFSEDPFFRWFFGNGAPGGHGGNQSEIEHALGSGVIVRPDGHIITNQHVVDGAQEIKVDLSDRRTFSAKLVGADVASDLALLKINANNLPVLKLGDSDRVRVGDVCLAVGNPLGIGETVTSGIISAKGRNTGLSNGSFQDFLQTDAAINQGNSGGALVNTRAELIGINSQIVSTTGGFIGIGFAIPSNMARSVMDQLISKGKVERGQLGVSVQNVTSDIAQSLGLKQVRGVLISSVTAGSPAEHAGLKAGDVILAMNGTPVNDTNTLRNQVASTAPGTDVTLTVLRNGHEQQMHAKLGEFKLPANQNGGQSGGGQGEPTGPPGDNNPAAHSRSGIAIESAPEHTRGRCDGRGPERTRRGSRNSGGRRDHSSEPPTGTKSRRGARGAGKIRQPASFIADRPRWAVDLRARAA